MKNLFSKYIINLDNLELHNYKDIVVAYAPQYIKAYGSQFDLVAYAKDIWGRTIPVVLVDDDFKAMPEELQVAFLDRENAYYSNYDFDNKIKTIKHTLARQLNYITRGKLFDDVYREELDFDIMTFDSNHNYLNVLDYVYSHGKRKCTRKDAYRRMKYIKDMFC